MRIILSLILSIYVCPVFATPEAEVHIQAMLDKYQSLNIYEDYGVTHIRYIKSDGSNGSKETKRNKTGTFQNKFSHYCSRRSIRQNFLKISVILGFQCDI